MENVTSVLPYFQTFLAFCNICVMLWVFRNFLRKPHDTLDAKISDMKKQILSLELKLQEVERSLDLGNDGFREQRETNRVMQNCMLALIDFELSYCSHTNYTEDTTDLLEAKKILRDHLADK